MAEVGGVASDTGERRCPMNENRNPGRTEDMRYEGSERGRSNRSSGRIERGRSSDRMTHRESGGDRGSGRGRDESLSDEIVADEY